MIPPEPSQRLQNLLAPSHEVPKCNHVAIEHPGIIKNLERGITSLGGDKRVAKVRLKDTVNLHVLNRD